MSHIIPYPLLIASPLEQASVAAGPHGKVLTRLGHVCEASLPIVPAALHVVKRQTHG